MKIAIVSLILAIGLAAAVSAQEVPIIVMVSPAQNELGAATNTGISVTFNVDMNQSTINGSSFIVNTRSTGFHQGIIVYDTDTKTATITPDVAFRGGEIVTAVLTADIQSSEGIALAGNFVWSFTISVPDGVDVFTPEITYPVHRAPCALFIADFNGDFYLDIVAANQGTADVSFMMNNGDSTFSAPMNFPVGEYPTSVAAGDLDGDADIDLVCSSRRFDNVAVIFNNGQGYFGPQNGYPTGDYPMSVITVDLDGDGDLDLVTANMWSNDITILLNNGNGTFGARFDVELPEIPLNSDFEGRWSELLATMADGNRDLYEIFSEFPVGNGPYSVASGDLDKDGDMDLATANINQGTISIIYNNGDATFESGPSYPTGEYPTSICLVDVNGDRDLDLVCSNMASNSISVFFQTGEGIWQLSGEHATGEYPVSILGADLDGDADIDILTANSWSDNITALYNDGVGVFSYSWNFPVGGTPFAVFTGDLSGDGGVDVVAANSATDNVSIYMIVAGCAYYVAGDFNYSGAFNVADILDMHSNLLTGSPPPGFTCDCAGRVWGVVGDVNNSCAFNISDVVDGYSYLKTGAPPVELCDECLPSHP